MNVKRLLATGVLAVFAFSALADDGGRGRNNNNGNNNGNDNNSSFESSVIGSQVGLAVGGVLSGGAPWVVAQGDAQVSSSGRIQVEIKGLLLASGASAGTIGPVTMVGASLVCGGSGGTALTGDAVTPSPLSTAGNAQIEQQVTLPTGGCFAPVVLVRVFSASAPLGSQLQAFIALTGLMPGAANNNNNNNNNNNDDHGGHGGN